jgi:hypothetical protein
LPQSSSRLAPKVWLDQKRGFQGKRYCVGPRQVRGNGSHYETAIDFDQVQARQSHPHPGVDHDALIEHSIKYIYEGGGLCAYQNHG